MHLSLIITIIIFTKAESQNFNELHFTRDEKTLFHCIENFHSFNEIKYHENTEIVKAIAGFLAPKLSGNINAGKIMINTVMLLINEVYQNSSFPKLRSGNVFWNQVQAAIMKALIHCSDDNDDKRCTESNHVANRRYLPEFEDEPPDLANVLNYILVDWPTSPRNMVKTLDGLLLLKSFSEDAYEALERAFEFDGNTHLFRALIRLFWARRAEKYFSFYNPYGPYIFHYYTPNDRVPHTCGCSSKYFRSRFRFYENDPMTPRQEIEKILNIHRMVRPDQDEDDVFFDYARNGMRSSQYYFELHIDQFYQILFFFQELRERNIRIDEKYLDIIPEDVLSILDNDTFYSQYLLYLREHLLETIPDTGNFLRQNLMKTARPYEEDMILLRNRPSTSGVTRSTSTTTTSTTTVRTTSSKPQLERKKDICESYEGQESESKRYKFFPNNEKFQKKKIDEGSVDSYLQQRFNYSVGDSNDEASMIYSLKQIMKIVEDYGFHGYVIDSRSTM